MSADKDLYVTLGVFMEGLSPGQQAILRDMLAPRQLAELAELLGMYETWKETGKPMAPLTISGWVARCHGLAVEKGWWPDKRVKLGDPNHLSSESILAKLMLVVSELSEAVEIARLPGFDARRVWADVDGVRVDMVTAREMSSVLPKPEGFGTEIGDAAIRIFDLCGALGIDLEARIAEKHDYNATRPYRHGNKGA